MRSSAFQMAAQQLSRGSNGALSGYFDICRRSESYKAGISSVFSSTVVDLLLLWPCTYDIA
jgi:hypothetical protein